MGSLEVCVSSVEEAELAIKCGADSVELCMAPEVGGLTFRALYEEEIQRLGALGEHVRLLIRLRPGSFCYTKEEVDIMCRQIETIRTLLPRAGFTIGALSPSGTLDRLALESLCEAAKDAELTFHRGIDILPEPWQYVPQIREMGFKRLLTSGGASSAVEGTEVLSLMQQASGDTLTIVAAGGVRAEHIPFIRTKGGLQAFHGGFRGVRDRAESSSSRRATDGSYLDAWWTDSYLDTNLLTEALMAVKAV